MKKTFVDVLLELPVDTTLSTFLASHGLPVAAGFDWEDTPRTSQALVEAVRAWPDVAARDRLIGNLMASVQLADPAGKQAMFQAAAGDGAALLGLMGCASSRRSRARRAGRPSARPWSGWLWRIASPSTEAASRSSPRRESRQHRRPAIQRRR